MTRVAVTSDLHFDIAGNLTPPQAVAALVEEIRAAEPAAVVLAGDLGHPLENFRRCLAAFRPRNALSGRQGLGVTLGTRPRGPSAR